MEEIQTVVVGAGVVGLAVAAELARSGREVVILEQAAQFGTGTSSRNSEVIHAGIYYEPGSLKARLCVEGRRRLYTYCAERGVGHRRCGKLIVATDESQISGLEKIMRRAQAAGVDDLRWVDSTEAVTMEPALSCVRALLSPSTGIVDTHGLMLALLGEAEDHGAMLARLSRVTKIDRVDGGFHLDVATEDGTMGIRCRELVNSAGLGAVALAGEVEALPAACLPKAYMAKGNYFSLGTRCPFSRLIYPIPNEAGLGVHLTIDLAGQGKFGPDVEWVQREVYEVDPTRGDSFYAEIRRYWPGLPAGALQPAYSGIRPKIAGPEEPAADFIVSGPGEHGIEGLVNLFGIESPGVTSSLALGAMVLRVLEGAKGHQPGR